MLKTQTGGFIPGTKVTGAGWLCSVTAATDGTNPSTVTVYDNTAASGTVLATAICAGGDFTQTINFAHPIRAENGIHFTVTGTGASGNITYATESISQF